MTTTVQQQTIRDQVQAGIDARLAVEPVPDAEFTRAAQAATARMLGLDGTTVEDAARQAYVAGGPKVEEIAERIRARRASSQVRRSVEAA